MADLKPIPDGSCLCGSITYTLRPTAEPLYNVVCHCVNCAKQTGTSFSTNAIWRKEDVEFKDLRDTLHTFEDWVTDSTNALSRHFCGTCSSPVYATTPLWTEIVSIFAGTYSDRERWKPPFKEQYLECKRGWIPDFGERVGSKHERGPL